MKRFIFLVLITLISANVTAHNPAVATFHLTKGESVWQLRSEFAWPLRNALLKSFPFLEDASYTEEIYTDCVLDYLSMKIDLRLDNQSLKINSIQQIPGEHGHSFVFISELSGPTEGSLLRIKNVCMTEMYRKQRNIVFIKSGNKRFEKICTRTLPNYSFEIS